MMMMVAMMVAMMTMTPSLLRWIMINEAIK